MSLLETKFFAPSWRSGSVHRPHLVAKIGAAVSRPVTLIAAPAGSGKTTLLAEWLATPGTNQNRVVSWLSLDRTDNDPTVFWTYLITALHRDNPDIGRTALELLNTSRSPAIEQVLTKLLNDLARNQIDQTLILDDIHVIADARIHTGLAYLIDGLPERAHLVLLSRSDPPLPLSRMRARGELSEIRVADLRFSPEETDRFLNEAMRLKISRDESIALQRRTEGWVAGLQLAALSLRGIADSVAFVDAFSGDDRYIVDYLIEEVLQQQSPAVRAFLLQTSIVERLSASLGDAITGQQDSRQTLEYLDRANLFLIPLDNRREWYRYHHLFADVLRSLQISESPQTVADLHRRASRWFEANSLTPDAIAHAIHATDYARAADLIEQCATSMRQLRQETTLIAWVGALPEFELQRRPVLSAVYAALLLQSGQFEQVEELFAGVERMLADPPPDMVVFDQEEFARLPASLAVHRSGISLVQGQTELAGERARRALTVILPDDYLYRGAAESLIGLSDWYRGDLESAYQSFNAGMESLYKAGNVSDTVGGMVGTTDLLIAMGRLRDADLTFKRALQRADQHGNPFMRGTADMHTGLAAINLEWNDLDAAEVHRAKSRSLGDGASFPQNPWRLLALEAELAIVEGKFVQAIDLLNEAEEVYTGDFFPNVRPIHAMRARVWIRAGELDRVERWRRDHALEIDDELDYQREYQHITLARFLLAKHRSSESTGSRENVTELLKRLLIAAQTGRRPGVAIEILILQALDWADRGKQNTAYEILDQALSLAEPERYTRVFLNEGEAMRTLLRELQSDYARQVRQAFATPATVPTFAPQQSLIEPLTPRELEVLQLIAAGLRNEEIADRLYISLATVKRHIANTYGKLGVTHRTEAVARANTLNLLQT